MARLKQTIGVSTCPYRRQKSDKTMQKINGTIHPKEIPILSQRNSEGIPISYRRKTGPF